MHIVYRFRHRIRGFRLSTLTVIAAALLLCSCAGYHPVPVEQVHFRNGIQTHKDGMLTVSVSILTEHEAKKVFGVDLASKHIQAVWLKVVNDSSNVFFLFKSALDPDYFSAYEVAYMQESIFHPFINDKIVQRIKALAFRNPIPSHSTVTGFLFIHMDQCQRQICLDLATYGKTHQLIFFFELDMEAPTLFDVEKQMAAMATRNISKEKDLRKALTHLPSVTTGRDGKGTGDPVNLILVGRAEELFPAFVKRHWHITEPTGAHTIWKMVESFVFGTTYLHSPISPLYLFHREQDIALQKARETVNQRNHLRLWLTDIRYRNRPVWAGTISRDVGIRFTLNSPFLVTHKIDPDIDEVRNTFGTDMLFSRNVEAIGFVKGVVASTSDRPRHNLTGDEYFTDGLRLVLFFSRTPLPLSSTRFLKWEPPVGRHM